MSLLTEASLVVTPNANKSGKLYSVIPSNGNGDFTVTRATTATRVNSAGLVESVAIGVPRLDYSLGSCPNLLLEPQRTNLLLRSEEFDNSTVWTSSIGGTGVAPIRTANSVVSPSGVQNADSILLNRGAGNTTTDQCNLIQFITVATTGTYYFSVWMKATTSGDIGKQVFIRCGNTASLQPVTLTATWARYETTATVTLGSNQFQIGNRGVFTASNSVSVDLWGAQLEAGAYATSYIPTTSASVTRNADVVSKTGISSLIGQTEGTFVFKVNVVQPIGLGVQLLLKVSNDSESQLFIVCYVNNAGAVAFDFYIGASFTFSIGSVSAISKGFNTIGVVYKAGAYKLYINGTQVATSTNSSPITNTISKLSINSGAAPMYYDFLNVWKTALTDTQCTQLTTL
jgi:hypothetical protein